MVAKGSGNGLQLVWGSNDNWGAYVLTYMEAISARYFAS